MKNHSKIKLAGNFMLMVIVIAILFYVMDNSLNNIIHELLSTSLFVAFLVLLCGFAYQIVEGRSIKEIAYAFNPEFTTKDGFFTSCYVAFYRVISFGTGTLLSEVLFYRKKGLHASQGIGITALHMIMYKVAVIFLSALGLIFQFSVLYESAPKMILFILLGMLITFLIIFALVILSSNLNVQIIFVSVSNKLFKSKRIRRWIDQCNLQIYSLRETVQSVTQDRSALLRIFGWNVAKLLIWYIIPYVVLMQQHPKLDLLLVMSFTSFAVILSGVLPTPAGIGPFEFVYLLLFKPLVGSVDAVSSLLLYRFASFVLPFLIGSVYVLVDKRKKFKEEIDEVRREKVDVPSE